MQEEISAVPIAQQAYLRQFWDEAKQRFSEVKLLFGTQPYGSFQPAFAVAEGQSYLDCDNTSSQLDVYADRLNNIFKKFDKVWHSKIQTSKQTNGSLSGAWKPANESMSNFSKKHQKQITNQESKV
jgi:hypothetical protein